jgi:NDP-sugar pyrophosphorylase family protein
VAELAEIITDHFGDGSAFGVEIGYLREEAPLGTAGALSLLDEPLDAPLLVMNGDLLTRVDFGGLLEFHRDHGGDATLCVRRERMQAAFGVVETDGDRFMTGLVEKPTYEWLVNCGIYALSPRALDILPPGQRFDMTDALKRLADDGRRRWTRALIAAAGGLSQPSMPQIDQMAGDVPSSRLVVDADGVDQPPSVAAGRHGG